jgi:hypothetical protein
LLLTAVHPLPVDLFDLCDTLLDHSDHEPDELVDTDIVVYKSSTGYRCVDRTECLDNSSPVEAIKSMLRGRERQREKRRLDKLRPQCHSRSADRRIPRGRRRDSTLEQPLMIEDEMKCRRTVHHYMFDG